MIEGVMDESELDAKAQVLKKLIKDLMLVDNPKSEPEAIEEDSQSVSLDGDEAGEGEDEAQVLEESSEDVAEGSVEDLEDIANYKRG